MTLVFHSRDVIFREDIFPYRTHSPSSPPTSPTTGVFPFIDFPIDNDPISSPTIPSTSTPIPNTIPHTSPATTLVPSQPSSPISSPTCETSVSPTPIPAPAPIRRSTRHVTEPSWLKDFVVTAKKHASANSCVYDLPSSTSTSTHIPYPIFTPTDLAHIPSDYVSFLANVFTVHEPANYLEASQDKQWVAAMDKELDALEKNDTLFKISLTCLRVISL